MSDDVIIIGGGHNGLTCACYLAAAGLRVRVLERRAILGGAAVTEEFSPGFRNSSASYTVSLLNPKVVRDLRLAEHGLRVVERSFANFVPLPEGGYLRYGGDLAATQDSVRRFCAQDATRLPAFLEMIDTVADFVRPALLETPPNVDGGWADVFALLRSGRRFAALDGARKRGIADLLTRSAGDLLDAWFDSDPIKVPFGFDAVVGNFASPYASGSGYVLLHHALGEVNGKRGTWGHAIVELAAERLDKRAALVANEKDAQAGVFASSWVLVADNRAVLDDAQVRSATKDFADYPNLKPWTDNYSSLYAILH